MSEQTSTEVLRGLRVFSLPATARWLLLGILISLGIVNAVLFFEGIAQDGKAEWVKASLELMSVILPFFLLATVIFFSSSIASQTRRQTMAFLLVEAPVAFAALLECEGVFKPRAKRISRAQLRPQSLTTVKTRHAAGSCCADYLLSVPADPSKNSSQPQTLLIRLELNVHRLTFCLGIDSKKIPKLDQQTGPAYLAWFLSAFPSSIAGAKHHAGTSSDHTITTFVGYNFNRSEYWSVAGKEFQRFVASRDLESNFLWDASERIFILQDMQFMLRAFLAECPVLFSEPIIP